MLLGDESQREEHDRPRACDAGTNEVEGLHGRKRNTRGLNAGSRSKQRQVQPKGVILLHVVFGETEIVVHLHKNY